MVIKASVVCADQYNSVLYVDMDFTEEDLKKIAIERIN